MHHYDFSMEQLPSGVINPTGPIRSEEIGQHVSWTVQILPYMEEGNVYRHFDSQAGAYAAVNEPVRIKDIALLQCPSSPGIPTLGRGQGIGAFSSYAGCHHGSETPIDSDNNGLLFLNSHIRYRDIADGSSHTILLGELQTSPPNLSWVSGTRSTLRNASKIGSTENWNQQWQSSVRDTDRDPLQVGGFASFHTGGANFVFADGAVRFVSQNVLPEVLRNSGNRADGEINHLP